MTGDLTDLLVRRADRARSPDTPENVANVISIRADDSARRHRDRLALASIAAVVVVAGGIGLAITDGGTTPSDHSNRQQVGAEPNGGNPSADIFRTSELERQRAAAAAAQQRAAAAAQRRAEEQAANTLVPAAPAPSDAEISLGLLPKGFAYVSSTGPETFYATPGTTDQPNFAKDILVDVHQFAGSAKDYTLTVDGRPAYYGTSNGFTVVRVRYSDQVDVGFQAPPTAPLTRVQALRMAAALDVRSTLQRTHG